MHPQFDPYSRSYASLAVRDLLEAREAYHVHLCHLDNVFATAIGRYLIRRDDPDYYAHPWYMRDTYAWRPDLRIAEYSCEENNRNRPVNGHTVAK